MKQRREDPASPLDPRSLLGFGMKLLVLGITCGLVMGQQDGARKKQGDPDRIVFPSSSAEGSPDEEDFEFFRRKDSQLSKMLQLTRRINSLNTIEEFFDFINATDQQKNELLFESRLGDTERSNAVRAEFAKCIPELQPVSLKIVDDPSTTYYPPCTRIKRCGGCCGHDLLSCQPTETEIRNFEVVVVEIGPDMRTRYKKKEIVPLEEHTKCKCNCRIKREHCTVKQIYIEDECRCICTNTDDEQKCRNSNETKLWNPDQCNCLCRNVQECTTGYYFDQNTCSCRQLKILSQFTANTKRTGYTFGQTQRPDNVPPMIVTLDASDPRRKHMEDPEYK